MDFNTKILKQLYEYALEDRGYKRYYLAAALVHKREILSIGWNSYSKSHPLQKKFAHTEGRAFPEGRVFLHAEIDAFRRYLRYNRTISERVTVYTCHAGKYGWRPARPCPGCMGALHFYGIERVIFSERGTGSYSSLVLDSSRA